MKRYVDAALLSRVNAIVSKRAEKSAALAKAPAGEQPKEWFHFVRNESSGEATLYIYDAISSYWGIGDREFVEALNEVDSEVLNIHLNSPGGSVFEGFAIYAAIMDFSNKKNAKVNMIVDGWAASIASVIMCAGDRIKIGEHASVMIHKPWSLAIGSADDMREEAEVLDMLEESIIDIYVDRTGGDREQIKQWVADETWFRGKVAVESGFADEVIPLKKKDDDAEDSAARPAASQDANYFSAIFPNMPDEVRAALTERSASDDKAKLPKTIREFKDFLRDSGFSGKQADAIAGHGFKDKSDVRDEPAVVEDPTTQDRRDDAEKRDEAVAIIRAAANAMAIRAAAIRKPRS